MVEPPPAVESFKFLDPGPLVDGDLEIIAPENRWIDEALASCHHPDNLLVDPGAANVTRQNVVDFITQMPRGRQQGNPELESAPSYHFWMLIRGNKGRLARLWHKGRVAGGLSLRIGANRELLMYTGHIGYHVYAPFRGNHYALRACRLILPLARRHGLGRIWITCNPDNIPSRRTCEALGARLVDIVPLPADHPLYAKGERRKCRYVL